MATVKKDSTKTWLLKRWWIWGLILIGLGVGGAFTWSESSSKREILSQFKALDIDHQSLEAEMSAIRENNIRLQLESSNYKAKYETAMRESAKYKKAVVDAQGRIQLDGNGNPVFDEGSSSSASTSSQTQELQRQVQTLTEENKTKEETIQRQASTITSQTLKIDSLKESETKKRDGTAIIAAAALDTRDLPGIHPRGFTGLGATVFTIPLLNWEFKAAVGGVW